LSIVNNLQFALPYCTPVCYESSGATKSFWAEWAKKRCIGEMAGNRGRNGGNKGIVRTLGEQVAAHVRQDVLSGQLAKGDRLREIELAERFGVSRGPVRDALLQLAHEGLLILQPHCGATVAGPASDLVLPLIRSIRRTIEVFALRLILQDLDDGDFQFWKSTLAQMKAACVAGDVPAIVVQDIALHHAIVERTGQSELLDLWLPLVARMRFAYSRFYKDLLEVYEEHRAIIEAMRARDLAGAVKALETTIK
jgi:DNA-binding GntR family transcriptional regulator